MSFVQIVSFETDDITPFESLEHVWLSATEGRRTLVDGALYRDRGNPRRYVSINHFASYEEAMVNSALPETDAFAQQAMQLSDGPAEFTDLDRVSGFDVRENRAAQLRTYLETHTAPEGLFTDDVRLDMFVPQWAVVTRGVQEITAGLAEEAPSRTFEMYDVDVIADGFVAEYAYRTEAFGDTPSTLSVGSMRATLRGTAIASLRVHCAGNWTDELEQQVLAAGEPHLVSA